MDTFQWKKMYGVNIVKVKLKKIILQHKIILIIAFNYLLPI